MNVADRVFSVRFDVDTPLCINTGVPNLLKLAKDLDVRFTFFVNMGRSISLRHLVSGKRNVAGNLSKLPSREKLGALEVARTVLLNPFVGSGSGDLLRAAAIQGHEIGLHGGRNHGSWQHAAHRWDENTVASEIAWGKTRLEDSLGAAPMGFSSPGWNGGAAVDRVLARAGFGYSADLHGDSGPTVVRPGPDGVDNIRTHLAGEPGGVGYLEWHRARGHDNKTVLDILTERLAGCTHSMVMYDHPLYAGIRELELLRSIIGMAVSLGFRIAPMNELLGNDPQDD